MSLLPKPSKRQHLEVVKHNNTYQVGGVALTKTQLAGALTNDMMGQGEMGDYLDTLRDGMTHVIPVRAPARAIRALAKYGVPVLVADVAYVSGLLCSTRLRGLPKMRRGYWQLVWNTKTLANGEIEQHLKGWQRMPIH